MKTDCSNRNNMEKFILYALEDGYDELNKCEEFICNIRRIWKSSTGRVNISDCKNIDYICDFDSEATIQPGIKRIVYNPEGKEIATITVNKLFSDVLQINDFGELLVEVQDDVCFFFNTQMVNIAQISFHYKFTDDRQGVPIRYCDEAEVWIDKNTLSDFPELAKKICCLIAAYPSLRISFKL